MDTASAPFADVMRRAAVTEKPQRSEAADDNSAPRASSSPAAGQSSTTGPGTTGSDRTEPSPALAATRQTSPGDQKADAELEDSSQAAAADTHQILQSLEDGDMSALHAVLASLSGKIDAGESDGTTSSNMENAGDGSDSLNGEDLAAFIAALPLAMTAQPAQSASGAAQTPGTGTLNTGQASIQQMVLAVTDAARTVATTSADELAGMAGASLSENGDQPGSSAGNKASSSQQGLGGLLSAIDANRNGNSGVLAGSGLAPGDPAAAGLLNNLMTDALPATDIGQGDLDIGALLNHRPDAGSLTSLSSSLSNALGMSPTAATAANGAIATSVHSPQWPASFGQQVLQMYQRGDQQMSLRLHPQDLGPLSVSLTVQDQQAQLQILSAHAPVRAAVEAAIPQLRQALADSGIALGEAMVGDQGQFQQGQSPNDDQPRRTPGTSGSLLSASGIVDTSDETTLRQVAIGASGNINLYA